MILTLYVLLSFQIFSGLVSSYQCLYFYIGCKTPQSR